MAVATRYSTVAMALHWLIATVILLLLPMGWWMTAAVDDSATQLQAYRLFQVHKALGFLVLALTIVRIGWRVTSRPPSLADGMRAWGKFSARAAQYCFYGLLLALPLSGWVYISAGWAVASDQPLDVATSWFGLFSIPHIEPVEMLAEEARRAVAFRAASAHTFLAWGAVVLIALHIGAALKHHFIDRDSVLISILPWGEVRDEPAAREEKERHWPALLAGLGTAMALLAAGAIAQAPPPRGTTAQDHPAAPAKVADAPIRAGTAIQWVIDPSVSAIRFSGRHAGAAFNGRFTDWNASIWFDPTDLAGSRAFADIRTGSASTGDATQEVSLQGAEWFDPGNYPTARFDASSFRSLGGDRYEADGTLRIKAVRIPVTLRFTFSEQSGLAAVTGQFTLDRTALDLGLESDATGAWVSKEIAVEISLKAKRSGQPRPAH